VGGAIDAVVGGGAPLATPELAGLADDESTQVAVLNRLAETLVDVRG
jgi:hypothetical protein